MSDSATTVPVPPTRAAARLGAWLRAWRAGHVSLDDVVSAITGEELVGIDQVVTVAGRQDPAMGLLEGFSRLSATPSEAIRVVLPVPGDARGLPVSGEFAAEALTVGEAVIAGDLGVVPYRRRHLSGSGDSWETIEWRFFPIPQPVMPPEPISVAEADMALSDALRDTTAQLGDLDVTSWNPRLGEALRQVRDPQGRQLPAGYDPRARRLFARAVLLDRALHVANHDSMNAVNAFETSARREALRDLASSCRQAITAVCQAPLSY